MPRPWHMPDAASSRPVKVAVGVVTAVVLLAACTGGGMNAPARASVDASPLLVLTPDPRPSPIPSATSTPKPARPPAMDGPGLDGAIATATYFLELFPYSLNTGDLTGWTLLSHAECIFCGGLSDEVKRQSRLGQHQEGTVMTIRSATGVELRPGVAFSVDISYAQGPWAVVDSTGTVVEEAASTESLNAKMVVMREADRWLIRAAQVAVANG